MAEIAEGPPPVWATSITQPAGTPADTLTAASEATSRPRRRVWVGLAGLMACAAGILLGLLLDSKTQESTPPSTSEPAPRVFAKLSRKAGAVEVLNASGDVIPTEEGAELPTGFTLRTGSDDSLAVVELVRDNTRVEIEPDSVVRFAGGSSTIAGQPRLFLAAGQLTAAVMHGPNEHPLIVGTAVAEVFARSGTFVVSSAGPESARVDIKHGKVELVRAAAPKPVPLVAGGAAVVHAGPDRMDIERHVVVDRIPNRTLPFPGPRAVAFSPDGGEVWLASARLFTRWAASRTDVSFYRRGNDGVAGFSRDRKFLLTFREDRALLRTLPDGGEQAAINTRLGEPRSWALAPDASWLAVVDPKPNHKRVRVFDVPTGEERFVREFTDNITCVAATPDGKNVAVGVHSTVRGVSNKVVFLDAKSSDRLHALSVLKRPPTAMTFSSDGRLLAVGFNGTVQLWDVRTMELVRSITGFERPVACLTFSANGRRLAAGTHDGHVWVWDVASGRQTQLIETGGRVVRAIAFSPNGKQLVTMANNTPVAVWDVAVLPTTAELQ
jgi:WD40 repeat protein